MGPLQCRADDFLWLAMLTNCTVSLQWGRSNAERMTLHNRRKCTERCARFNGAAPMQSG